MLSWEYPPVVVGGLGRHVHALSTALVRAGHEVTVVTRHAPGAPLEEYAEGVRIVRAPEDPPLFPLDPDNMLAWTMAFNHTLTRSALRAAENGEYDVIHAHDWLVAHSAVTLKEHLDLPLVATIHATEAGRHQGWLPEPMNRCIHSVEWWLAHEACRVIVCSEYMRWEVNRLLEIPTGRIEAVPNGVDVGAFQASSRAVVAARARFAGTGPMIGFAGRLVYEKGVQDLLAAVPRLASEHAGLRVVLAGDGPYKADLVDEIRRHRLHNVVSFTGFLGVGQLPAVMAATDTMVVPSIYEPFGMVALEAAAAGAPLAVASTGGLAEIVHSGETGMTFPAQNPDALADAVGSLLADEPLARRVATRAKAMVGERYGWATIAENTAAVYARAGGESPVFAAEQTAAEMEFGRPSIVVPEGNLLAV
ncbi:glycosyltransferase family 4 protein [Virgisporangium aurantiacum]|nr:glycosyltransferase family 4 protein [Virgisporangium aurantiacum]